MEILSSFVPTVVSDQQVKHRICSMIIEKMKMNH